MGEKPYWWHHDPVPRFRREARKAVAFGIVFAVLYGMHLFSIIHEHLHVLAADMVGDRLAVATWTSTQWLPGAHHSLFTVYAAYPMEMVLYGWIGAYLCRRAKRWWWGVGWMMASTAAYTSGLVSDDYWRVAPELAGLSGPETGMAIAWLLIAGGAWMAFAWYRAWGGITTRSRAAWKARRHTIKARARWRKADKSAPAKMG